MGSIRTTELVQKITKTSVTTISLPSGSRLNIGAQQYSLASALTLNTAVTGVGGVDVAVAANSVYYTYAVVSSNVVYLIASLNSSLPAGYSQARKVGAFTTGTTSQILEAFYYGQGSILTDWGSYTSILQGYNNDLVYSNQTTIGKSKRITDTILLNIRTTFQGPPGVGVGIFTWSLPTGLSVDATKVCNSGPSGNSTIYCAAYNAGSSIASSSYVEKSGAATRIRVAFTKNPINSDVLSPAFPAAFANGDYIEFTAQLPIAEWAGSGAQFVW